jgi:hypothetical protein
MISEEMEKVEEVIAVEGNVAINLLEQEHEGH